MPQKKSFRGKKHSPAASASSDLGLPKCGQATWARVVRVHALLCQRRPFTARSLGEALEVSPKTILRTLDFMRDRLGAPIEFDPAPNTHRYTREWLYLPMVRVLPRESWVLKLLARILPDDGDRSLGRSLREVLRKFEVVVGGAGDICEGALENLVLPAALLGAAELRHLPEIQQAIAGRRELQIHYRKPGAPAPEAHVIQPHILRFIRRQWVLLAHDTTRGGALRTFLLRRVREAATMQKTFTPPENFDAGRMLDGNFGAYTGTEDHLVRIRLRHAAAVDALEEPWHPSQRHSTCEDGAVEITLRLNNLVEIRHEVLKWGLSAEAIEPPALRAAVRESLLAAAAQYQG